MKLIIELKSDAIPGAGEGLSGIVDTEINCDEFGIPYLPAKRIKGILRESALELNKTGILQHNFEDFFGTRGKKEGTGFKISDGYLDNAHIYRNFLNYASDNENKNLCRIFNKEAVLETFTYLRSQTEIENGTARKHSLRTFRVLKKGLIFHFPMELPEKYHEDFKIICKVTRRFGISRTRGLGEIAVVFDDKSNGSETKENASGNDIQFPDKADKCKLILDIENHGQLLMASRVGQGRKQATESFIPGHALLGAIAGTFLKNKGIGEKAHQDKNFRDIFLGGSVVFSNAYPLVENMEDIRPTPVTLVKEKDTAMHFDLAHSEDYKKAVDGGLSVEIVSGDFTRFSGIDFSTFLPDTEIEYHHRRPDDKGKGHAQEGDGEFYQFSVLKAGQRFRAEVKGPKEMVKKIADLLQKQETFYLGKSKTAQYGKCSIVLKNIEGESVPVDKPERMWENGKTKVFTLMSDMILRNEHGFACPDPEYFMDEVAECLEEENKGGVSLEIEKSFLDFVDRGGFLGIWRMPKIQHKALKAGSVILLKNNSGNPLNMKPIMGRSFGANREEGYGQVQIDWHGECPVVYRKYVPGPPDFPAKDIPGIKEFIKSIFLERLARQLNALAVQAADNAVTPTNSFIGKMAMFFKNAASFDDLNNSYLEKLRERGKKQLEKIERTLRIKNVEKHWQKDGETIKEKVKHVDREEVKRFIISGKVYQVLSSPGLRTIFEKAKIDEHFFVEDEKTFFNLYKGYAAAFLNTLKLLNRRKNEL